MASAKIVEATSVCNGVRKTTRNIDDFVAYRHSKPGVGPKIATAAELFVTYKSNYTYNRGSNPFKGKKVTAETIKNTHGALDCSALAKAAIEAAQGKNQNISYNSTPSGFTSLGKASKASLSPGDLLIRNPGSKGGHVMIFVGAGSNASLTPTMTMRLQYPRYEDDFYFSDTNGFYGVHDCGPPSIYHNCTWYAYGRFCEIAKKKVSGLPTGDARTWYGSWKGKKGSTPQLGSVAVFSGGTYGHVGVVEKLFDNGDILTSNSAYNSAEGGKPAGKPSASQYNYSCKENASDLKVYPFFYTKRLLKSNNWSDSGMKLLGFIYQDEEPGGELGAGGGAYVALDLKQTSSKLKSSENYKYLYDPNEEPYDIFSRTRTEDIKQSLLAYKKESENAGIFSNEPVPDTVLNFATASSAEASQRYHRVITTPGILPVTDSIVQAPFVELDFGNGKVIGSYLGVDDVFPNHITSMSVEKVNGEINQYTFNLIHQIRPNEDPNTLDELLSTSRYNYIGLRYGDSAARTLYKDEKLAITNVVMNRDYANSKITYTIYAVSTCKYIDSYKLSFPAVFDKPSNQILKLLYDDPRTSKLLLEAFPAMANKAEVLSKGWIPTNDNAIYIQAQENISPTDRISFLANSLGLALRITGDVFGAAIATSAIAFSATTRDVAADLAEDIVKEATKKVGNVIVPGVGGKIGEAVGSILGSVVGAGVGAIVSKLSGATSTLGMALGGITAIGANIVAKGVELIGDAAKAISTFLTYDDDKFYITQIRHTSIGNGNLNLLTNTIFSVTVGYPGDECIMSFTVDNDPSWSLLYNKGLISSEYVYAINRQGETVRKYSPNLTSSSRTMTMGEIAWWSHMTSFPISATLTIKGLLKPVKLMDYVNVNVNFYGYPHVTSGLYVITAEQEVLSLDNGFTTRLTLLRVDNE